jgi:hypothetical protein
MASHKSSKKDWAGKSEAAVGTGCTAKLRGEEAAAGKRRFSIV